MKLLPQDNNDLDSATDSIKMEANQVEQGSGLKGSPIHPMGGSKFFSECSSLNSSIVSYDSESDLDLSWENVESSEINRNSFLKKATRQDIPVLTNRRKNVKTKNRKLGEANRPNPSLNTIPDPSTLNNPNTDPFDITNEVYITKVIAPLNNRRKRVIANFLRQHLHVGNDTDAVEFVAKNCKVRPKNNKVKKRCKAALTEMKVRKSRQTFSRNPFKKGYNPPDYPGGGGG